MGTKVAQKKILSNLHPSTILKPNPDPNTHPNPQPSANPTPTPTPSPKPSPRLDGMNRRYPRRRFGSAG